MQIKQVTPFMPEKSILDEIRTEWFTPETVAEALDVDVSTVYRWLNSGTLPGIQLGKKWRITEADIRRFIREERLRQEYKIRHREALHEARKELGRRQAQEPDQVLEIGQCACCELPIVVNANSHVAEVCSKLCAEALDDLRF